MSRLFHMFGITMLLSLFVVGGFATPAISGGGPAQGYDIHVQAPHLMPDGTPGGPFHHYCKGISDKILQCLLFETTDGAAGHRVAVDLSATGHVHPREIIRAALGASAPRIEDDEAAVVAAGEAELPFAGRLPEGFALRVGVNGRGGQFAHRVSPPSSFERVMRPPFRE